MGGLPARLIVVAIAVPVAMVSGYQAKKERIATYHITEIDQPIMNKCTSLMSGENVEFAKGASNADGCACIAKHATSEILQKQLDAFTKTLGVTLDIAQKANNLDENDTAKSFELMMEAVDGYSKVKLEAGLSDKEFTFIDTKVGDYIKTCGDRDSHKGESLTRIASLAPIGYSLADEASSSKAVSVTPQKTDDSLAAKLRK